MNTMGKKRKGNALAAQPLPSQNAMITGTIAPADPTIAMRFGEAVTPWFDAAKSVFPESNPHGQALKNFLLGSAPESAERMAQGYTNVLGNFRGDNPLNYNLNQNALDMAGALPIGAAADTAMKLGMLGKAGLGVKEAMLAFHGSPHKFDKFDLSKIGTGEGAQAYGHGLYFAENPAVAKGYSTSGLIGTKGVQLADRVASSRGTTGVSTNVEDYAVDALTRFDGDKKAAIDWLDDFGSGAEARKWIKKNIKGDKADLTDMSNLYHVDIPDDQIEKMLDWDKPLSKQPEALRALGYDAKTAAAEFGKDATGQTLANKIAGRKPRAFSVRGADGHFMKSEAKTYDEAVQLAGGNQKNVLILNKPEIASQIMKEAGIPGIKYLDAGSRGAGNGTRNFVVFDDKIPKILKRE